MSNKNGRLFLDFGARVFWHDSRFVKKFQSGQQDFSERETYRMSEKKIGHFSRKLTCNRFHRISPRRGGGGDNLIFSYIRWLGSFFGVKNFEFQYFFGFSEK